MIRSSHLDILRFDKLSFHQGVPIQDLHQISLKDFFEKLEGPLGLMDCYSNSDCVQMKSCNILTPIQRINQNMRDMFSNTSLQEITQ